MSTALSIKFDVCPQGLKKSFRDMFAGAESLIREVAQNAHRAKATQFHIEYTAEDGEPGRPVPGSTIVLSNNGKVMGDLDWQRLFHVGRTGWDDSTRQSENPFGIGCAALVLGCEKVVIHSGYARAVIDCDSFFDSATTSVETVETYIDGSRFELTPKADVASRLGLSDIQETFRAFPIDVIVNTVKVCRDMAIDNSETVSVPFEYGHLVIPRDLHEIQAAAFNYPRFFAQGLPVSVPGVLESSLSNTYAVHLDITKVRPHVPDRTRLVDPPRDLSTASYSIVRATVAYFIEQKASEIGWVAVFQEFYGLIEKFNPELFARNDAPVKCSAFFKYEIPLHRFSDWQGLDDFVAETMGEETQLVTPDKFPPGFLVHEGDVELNPIYGNDIAWHNFAHDQGLWILRSEPLPHMHSAVERGFLPEAAEGDWVVDAKNPDAGHKVNFLYTEFTVVFCDGMTVYPPAVTLGDGTVTQWAPGIYTDTDYFAVNKTLYVGRKCADLSGFVSQISDFDVDDRSDYYERDDDAESDAEQQFIQIISGLRGDDIAEILTRSIHMHCDDIRSLKGTLAGQTFTLSFDDEGVARVTNA